MGFRNLFQSVSMFLKLRLLQNFKYAIYPTGIFSSSTSRALFSLRVVYRLDGDNQSLWSYLQARTLVGIRHLVGSRSSFPLALGLLDLQLLRI
jgi:hypothetical protein